ncbi:phytanoyl-CoA dioxygenase family protein [Kitasatospora sp. RG8]|uniref:phytanoyl-CoA dioxygenase family protein n=1 Tax=Kitasatospora sp. RG8 TaxID=2820815 RepID=UPI001AE02D30|nr:phytanoyl-CoA dioxygenase family protein [Kitasatospora sp. RG8]MBP0454017.1 phytanoyl-CoA dioxygenase family protein [Kitasatospora sp. RG8]
MPALTQVDGILGPRAVSSSIQWSTPGVARGRAPLLTAAHRDREIVRNPHLTEDWAEYAVRSPNLLAAVQAVLGPDVAVENTFLVVKWPGKAFDIPWHQDGIDAHLELHPERSVSAWLAVTDTTVANGCLEVAPGSQRLGYLPVEKEPTNCAERGRADQAHGFTPETTIPVPLRAGCAVLMDSRLVHRSGTNTSDGARIGLNVRYTAPDGILRRDATSPSIVPISGTGW